MEKSHSEPTHPEAPPFPPNPRGLFGFRQFFRSNEELRALVPGSEQGTPIVLLKYDYSPTALAHFHCYRGSLGTYGAMEEPAMSDGMDLSIFSFKRAERTEEAATTPPWVRDNPASELREG